MQSSVLKKLLASVSTVALAVCLFPGMAAADAGVSAPGAAADTGASAAPAENTVSTLAETSGQKPVFSETGREGDFVKKVTVCGIEATPSGNTFEVQLPYGSALPSSSDIEVTPDDGCDFGRLVQIGLRGDHWMFSIKAEFEAGSFLGSNSSLFPNGYILYEWFILRVSVAEEPPAGDDPVPDDPAPLPEEVSVAVQTIHTQSTDWAIETEDISHDVDLADETAVVAWVESWVDAKVAQLDLGDVAYEIEETTVVLPQHGTAENPDGVDGSFECLVSLIPDNTASAEQPVQPRSRMAVFSLFADEPDVDVDAPSTESARYPFMVSGVIAAQKYKAAPLGQTGPNVDIRQPKVLQFIYRGAAASSPDPGVAASASNGQAKRLSTLDGTEAAARVNYRTVLSDTSEMGFSRMLPAAILCSMGILAAIILAAGLIFRKNH